MDFRIRTVSCYDSDGNIISQSCPQKIEVYIVTVSSMVPIFILMMYRDFAEKLILGDYDFNVVQSINDDLDWKWKTLTQR